MNNIKIWENGTKERTMLENVASLLRSMSKYGINYEVKTIYFDFGQDWKWTTLVVDTESNFGGYQISPVEQEEIITCNTPEKLSEILHHYLDEEENRMAKFH